MVTIPCPKCKSRSTHITRGRHLWLPEPDEILVCMTCGNRVYGRERVAPLREGVLAAARREERRRDEEYADLDRAIEAERVARAAAEKTAAAEAAKTEAKRKAAERRNAEQMEILRKAKCAWPQCERDHTTTSMYCSRTCSNLNAHAREKAKKAEARSTAV